MLSALTEALNILPPPLALSFVWNLNLWGSCDKAGGQTSKPWLTHLVSFFFCLPESSQSEWSVLCIPWYMFDVFVSIPPPHTHTQNRCRRWWRWRLSKLLSVWMTEIISGPLLWGALQCFNIRLDNKRWFQRVSNTHKCHCDRMLWMLLVEIYCIQYLHSGSRNKSGAAEEWRWCP